jgi:hypothetical protein
MKSDIIVALVVGMKLKPIVWIERDIAEEIKIQRKFYFKNGVFDITRSSGKGTDLALIKQKDNWLLWDEIEFFIERI